MASTNVNSNWEKIQRGVKNTERFIGQKDYNAAMVQSRQTLEFMVKSLASRIGINENQDLMQLIDTLYQNRAISKSTCEHYHKIRMIGNKAAHEGDASAYNANQAYHILSQEVYSFANDYRNAQRRRPSRSHSSSRSRKKQGAKKASFQIYDLLKILIPILCIVLLILIIKLVKPAKDKQTDATPEVTTSESVSETETLSPPETTLSAVIYKTTATLNVRTEPNTDSSILGQLASGTEINFIEAHDDKWTKIMYNGQEAYVSTQHLTTE